MTGAHALRSAAPLRGPPADFPVVCVGGSAGGLDAYVALLDHLPPNLGAAIVVVNHVRTVVTRLHQILPHHTEMPVEQIAAELARLMRKRRPNPRSHP